MPRSELSANLDFSKAWEPVAPFHVAPDLAIDA